MTESELLDLTVLERKKYNYLNEALDRLEKSRKSGFSQEDIQRLEELCQGAAPQLREEGLFAEQAGKTRRLLERVVDLDRRLSLRLAGEDSFYQKK